MLMTISRRAAVQGIVSLPFGLAGSSAIAASGAFDFRGFLKDATGSEAVFRRFTEISTRKNEFLDFYGLTNTEYRTLSARTVRAKSLIATMLKEGWAFSFDWAGETEEFFAELDVLLKKRQSALDTKTLADQDNKFNATFPNERGQHVARIYGPVAQALEAEALLLATINDTSDRYIFFLLPRAVMAKWIGGKPDAHIEIMHPGKIFAKELKNSPYAKFANEPLGPPSRP